MGGWLKQSTAVTVKIGPFLSSSDFISALPALTIQKADVKLSKLGGTYAAASADQGASDAGAPHDTEGMYAIAFNTTDTGTAGRLQGLIKKAGALVVWDEWTVLPAAVYDALVGSAALAVNVTQIGGTAVANYFLDRLAQGARALAFGTADTGASSDGAWVDPVDGAVPVSVIPVKTMDPAAALTDAQQLRGKVITFTYNTASDALKGQSARIRGNSTTVLYTTPLTTLPAEDDAFAIT